LATAGATVPPQVAAFYESNNIPLVTFYGQTECVICLSCSSMSCLYSHVFCEVIILHGSTSPGPPNRWRFGMPVLGDDIKLVPVEGEEGGELVVNRSSALALGYIVDGELVPFSCEHHTNDIYTEFCILYFYFFNCINYIYFYIL
jgi:acyl-coenzyme A synthetase/AMP-(fatty) acid ligase